MEIECTGQLIEKGKISLNPDILNDIKIGSNLRIRIIVSDENLESKDRKGLSPAAKRLFERMKNAKKLGTPEKPEELSHFKLAEERMNEKFPWSE